MKAIRISEGKEVIFVQNGDLVYLCNSNLAIPKSIYLKIINTKVYNYININNYLKFDQPAEIIFFQNLDFIIDVDEYNQLSLIEIAKKYEIIDKGVEQKVSQFKKQDQQGIQDFLKNTEYQLNAIASIYFNKEEDLEPELPPNNHFPIKKLHLVPANLN